MRRQHFSKFIQRLFRRWLGTARCQHSGWETCGDSGPPNWTRGYGLMYALTATRAVTDERINRYVYAHTMSTRQSATEEEKYGRGGLGVQMVGAGSARRTPASGCDSGEFGAVFHRIRRKEVCQGPGSPFERQLG